MPDRFSEDSPGDLMRNFNASRWGRMEAGCRCIFKGDLVDSHWCELHAFDAGDQEEAEEILPSCPERYRLVMAAETVGELCDSLKAHKLICRECGGEGTADVELPKAA
jgi:hypothetical protein